jgi:hypothetical protein
MGRLGENHVDGRLVLLQGGYRMLLQGGYRIRHRTHATLGTIEGILGIEGTTNGGGISSDPAEAAANPIADQKTLSENPPSTVIISPVV